MDSLLRKTKSNPDFDEAEIAEEAQRPPKKNFRKWLFFILLIAIVAVVANLWSAGKLPSLASANYQAVFLANGQVYFGKLSNLLSSFPKLTDIYYLRVDGPIQPSSQGVQPNINLVKLGNELHRPKDFMKINRNHILFVEDMEASSAVVTAILEFKKSQ